jgi:hypothetical protein
MKLFPNTCEFVERYYLESVVVLAAAVILLLAAVTSPLEWLPWQALVILLFAIATELTPTPLLHGGTTVTVGMPVVFSVMVLYGTLPAVLVDTVPTLLAGILLRRERPLLHRVRWALFNASQSALVAAAAGATYHLLHAGTPYVFSAKALFALGVAAIVYLALNALLVSVASTLYDRRESWLVLWRHFLGILLPTYVVMVPLSIVVISLLQAYQLAGFLLLAMPFLAARECLRQRLQQIRIYRETIRTLSVLVQYAHPHTSGHLHRASQMAVKLAIRLGVPARHLELLPEAAILHDLGKIGIDDAVLNKISPLTEEEWNMIRLHPLKGAEIVSGIRHLAPVALWIALHHERPDGKGYPFGLRLGEIPIESHIIAVVDAFDAMVGDDEKARPYRKPKTVPEAVAELQRCAESQFHPAVVGAFVEALAAKEFDELDETAPTRTTSVRRAVA